MNSVDSGHTQGPAAAYEPPAVFELCTVVEGTLTGRRSCLFGKQLGGSDGFTWMGISVPISNCSR